MDRSVARERRATGQARKADTTVRRFFDECTDAIAVHREDKIVYTNPAALALFGYQRPDQVLGRSPFEFVSPSYRSLVAQRITTTYGGHMMAPELEERFLHASGREVPVEVLAVPMMFEGQPATLVQIRDLTARKELERKLAAADRLASVGFVAQAVVHEVDSPLAYAINNVSLLERYLGATLPEGRLNEARKLCARIRQGLGGVRDAMQDVRIFAESATEQQLDVNALLDSVANLAAFQLRGHARLVKQYGDVPLVAGTPTRLGQVFANILVFAAQTTPPGDEQANEVTLSTRPRGSEVVVEIGSTGARVGQIGSDRSFAITRSMLQDEGGSLAVQSREPRGATFVVTLRAASHGAD